jgi:hypothetical protein
MTVIFITITIGAIGAVIWYVRKPEPKPQVDLSKRPNTVKRDLIQSKET